MPDDFDVDAFMSGRRKSAGQTPAPTADFDVDAFMQGRAQKPAKPKAFAPGDPNDPLERSVQDHASRQRAMRPGTGGNIAIGGERGYRKYLQPAISSIAEATEGMKVGDFGPAWQMTKEAVRGTYNALLPPKPQVQRDASGRGMGLALRPPDPVLQSAQQRREARYAASPEGQRSAQRLAELDQRAALDPSYTGKATRGATELLTGAAPTLAAAIASRGALPIVGLTAAAQSANNPGMMGPNVAAGMLPAPSVGALARRLRGRPTSPATGARLTNPQVVRATQEMPGIQGPARPTQEIPGLSRLDVESAPTAGLLPVRERISELPELSAAEASPFGVRANLSLPGQYAGARGPRLAEAQFDALSAQARGAKPPVTPPPIDAELDKWARQPQQQPLFDAAARSPWQDTVLAYYRANLLTNPAGRALDLGSTVVNQVADAAVRPVSAAVDVIVSRLTGQRSITGPSLRGSGRAFGSIKQGLRDAREVLKTGKQTIDSGADDVLYGSEIRSGLGKAVDIPINGLFRVLGSMDAPFRRFGFERNLADRARVAAVNEAKRGAIPRNQITARAGELVDRSDIIAAAVRDGERAVLSEPNRISSWLSRQTASSPNARLAIGIVQPFMRIPLNAILRSADFSGVGGIKALYKIARGGVRKARGQAFFRDLEEQRVFAQNVASGSFAPAAFLLGMELEERGDLQGYFYTSKRDFPNGKEPTSIRIGGETYDVNRLGGFILAPLFIGATYNRLRKQGSDQANALLRSFSGLAQQAPALGYYGAPAKAGRILTADEPGEEIIKEAGSITSGFIPASGAMGAVAKAIDPVEKRKAEGFTGPIMSRIPGLRESLPAKEATKPIKAGGAYAAKLKEHGLDDGSVKAMKGEPPTLYSARVKRIEDWSDKYGAALVNNPGFAKLTPAQQKEALKSLQESIRAEANDREPNVGLFEPSRIIYAAKDSERAKAERNKRKFYVEE